jgi:RNase P subunit RPR2
MLSRTINRDAFRRRCGGWHGLSWIGHAFDRRVKRETVGAIEVICLECRWELRAHGGIMKTQGSRQTDRLIRAVASEQLGSTTNLAIAS